MAGIETSTYHNLSSRPTWFVKNQDFFKKGRHGMTKILSTQLSLPKSICRELASESKQPRQMVCVSPARHLQIRMKTDPRRKPRQSSNLKPKRGAASWVRDWSRQTIRPRCCKQVATGQRAKTMDDKLFPIWSWGSLEPVLAVVGKLRCQCFQKCVSCSICHDMNACQISENPV